MISNKEIFDTAIEDSIVGANLELALALGNRITVWDYSGQCGKSFDRLTTAIHEVGHAVVARHVGMPVHEARVFEQDEPESMVVSGVVHLSAYKDDWYKTFEAGQNEQLLKSTPSQVACSISTRMATIYCAGLVAELIHNDVDPGQSTLVSVPNTWDWKNAVHWAGRYQSNAVLLACQLTAYEILKASWSQVTALAHELATHGSISQEAINLAMSHCTSSNHGARLRGQSGSSTPQPNLH